MWYDGLLQFTMWEKVIAMLVLTHVSIVGVTVYLHRYAAHRSLTLHPIAQHFFRFWLWATTTIITQEFAAVHRKHHAKTETEEDPHSPKFYGLKELLWNGIHHYSVAARTPETISKYGGGCPDDWIEHNLYRKHANLGVSVLLVIYLALFGVFGLTMWALQMIWIPFLALGIINGVGHVWGYRNYECSDAATNISPWGIIIGGEELHNNHHAYPNSAKLSRKWWEFDIGWMWIKLMSYVGLAKVVSRGPVVERNATKSAIDADTVWATLNDRYQIMAKYSTTVIAPMIQAERDRLEDPGLVKRARHVLSRELTLLDDRAQEQIEKIKAASPNLATIYQKRLELLAIWQQRKDGAATMIESLQAWCESAEASGVQSLRDFAAFLKQHSIPKAASAGA